MIATVGERRIRAFSGGWHAPSGIAISFPFSEKRTRRPLSRIERGVTQLQPHSMPLTQFSLSNEVTAETAKQDRLQVIIGKWIVEGATDDIDALRNAMSSPPLAARNMAAENSGDFWGRLFDRPNCHGSQRPPIKVRGTPLTIGGQLASAALPGNGRSAGILKATFRHIPAPLQLLIFGSTQLDTSGTSRRCHCPNLYREPLGPNPGSSPRRLHSMQMARLS